MPAVSRCFSRSSSKNARFSASSAEVAYRLKMYWVQASSKAAAAR